MAGLEKFRARVKPNWCLRCGNFAIQSSLQKALANLGLAPEKVVLVTGIGCSGRIAGYVNSYGFHSIHGRALPTAQGVKLANRDLTVIAAGGDGDGLGIGLSHFIHAIRRNMDLTYIIMDNRIYGMTKGQTSPTSPRGFKSKSTPFGSSDAAIPALELALSAGAGFVAQGFSGEPAQLIRLIEEGIRYKGFAFIMVFSPCVTYNRDNSYEWFDEHSLNLEDMDKPIDSRRQALDVVMENEGLIRGIIYQEERGSFEEDAFAFPREPIVRMELLPSRETIIKLMQDFM
ncbi:MAG: 2-oxoacid:ferredoxin oxidoreductase subunit beta [Bacillota bacterium]